MYGSKDVYSDNKENNGDKYYHENGKGIPAVLRV
jgi:hypothetical protein